MSSQPGPPKLKPPLDDSDSDEHESVFARGALNPPSPKVTELKPEPGGWDIILEEFNSQPRPIPTQAPPLLELPPMINHPLLPPVLKRQKTKHNKQ